MNNETALNQTDRITSYYDIKENCNYLIYFKNKSNIESADENELKMIVTNGEKVWECEFDEIFYKNSSYNEFWSNLNSSINFEKFEINRFVNENETYDLEFKITNNNFKIILKNTKSSSIELKNLIFKLYEINLKLKTENANLIKQTGLISKEESKSCNQNFNQSVNSSNGMGLKKFSITKKTFNRKSSHSVVKKKKPKGIEFDEEETD